MNERCCAQQKYCRVYMNKKFMKSNQIIDSSFFFSRKPRTLFVATASTHFIPVGKFLLRIVVLGAVLEKGDSVHAFGANNR